MGGCVGYGGAKQGIIRVIRKNPIAMSWQEGRAYVEL